jgi:hypothetical protein
MNVSTDLIPGGSWADRGVIRSRSYPMLVSSLPALAPRFEVARLPIMLERLQARLRMLEPEDADTINRMLDILAWSRQVVEMTDAAVAKRYGDLMREISNPLVREVIDVGIAAVSWARPWLGSASGSDISVVISTRRILALATFSPGCVRSNNCSSRKTYSPSTGACWGKHGPT